MHPMMRPTLALRPGLSLRLGLTLLAALLAVAGCGEPRLTGLPEPVTPDGLVFTVADTLWTPGDTIPVLLANGSDAALGYNLCTATLEHRTDGGWRAAPSLPDRTVCTMELRTLEPGDSAFGRQVVDPFLQPGTYRFRTSVQWPRPGSGSAELLSNGFRIRAP